jgi:hypothetical protein
MLNGLQVFLLRDRHDRRGLVRLLTFPGHNARGENPERCAELLRQPEFGPSFR